MLASVAFARNELSIHNAVKLIQNGYCSKVELEDGIKVYACKDIVRIDIKNVD